MKKNIYFFVLLSFINFANSTDLLKCKTENGGTIFFDANSKKSTKCVDTPVKMLSTNSISTKKKNPKSNILADLLNGKKIKSKKRAIKEILIFDYGARNLVYYTAPVRKNIDVYKLKPGEGINKITDILMKYKDLNAVHIIGHGRPGYFELGSAGFNAATIHNVALWSIALSDDADILLYACDLAGNYAGVNLVNTLAQLTGADVAASENTTGPKNSGYGNSDWNLELKTGPIETKMLFTQEVKYMEQYSRTQRAMQYCKSKFYTNLEDCPEYRTEYFKLIKIMGGQ